MPTRTEMESDGSMVPTSRCPACRDTGYVAGPPRENLGRHYETLRTCERCPRGRAIEAGYWLDQLDRTEKKPADNERMRGRLRRLVRANPTVRATLVDDINELRDARRRRKGERERATDEALQEIRREKEMRGLD